MALRGIWQNAGGTRKQNGHWQSGGGGLLNAFLYSFGVNKPDFYFAGSVYRGASYDNDYTFAAGKWRDTIKITAVIKTAPINGRFSLAWNKAASGAFDRNTRITLYSQTAERFDFLMQEPTHTIITEDQTQLIENFKLIHTPTQSGRDPLTMDATATINYTAQTITLSATMQAGSLQSLEYDYDIDPAGDISRGQIMIGLQLDEDYTPERYPLYSLDNTTPNIRITG